MRFKVTLSGLKIRAKFIVVEWEDQAALVYAGLERGNVSFQAKEPAMPHMRHAGSGAGAKQTSIKDGDRRFRHGSKVHGYQRKAE